MIDLFNIIILNSALLQIILEYNVNVITLSSQIQSLQKNSGIYNRQNMKNYYFCWLIFYEVPSTILYFYITVLLFVC